MYRQKSPGTWQGLLSIYLADWLDADGLGYLDVDWGEPVETVRGETVDDVEEGLVEGLRGDGAHRAVADEDAVDRAEVGDLGGGAGEEGFVADVEHLAGQACSTTGMPRWAASWRIEARVMPLRTEFARGVV